MAAGKRPAADSSGGTPRKKAKPENLMWRLSVLQAKHGLVSESKVGKKAHKALKRGGVQSVEEVNEDAAAQIKVLEEAILQKKSYHRKALVEKALSKAVAAEAKRLEGRVAGLKEEVKKSGGNVNVVSETQPGARRSAKEKKLCAAAKELAAAKDVDAAELFDVVLAAFRQRKACKDGSKEDDATPEEGAGQVDVNLRKLAARMVVLPAVKSACGDYEETIETTRERMAAKAKEVKTKKTKGQKGGGSSNSGSDNGSDSGSDSDGDDGSDSGESEDSASNPDAKQKAGSKKERKGMGKGASKGNPRDDAPTWLGKSNDVGQADNDDVAAHPSWVAKKKQVNVAEFTGSKVTFGDSDGESVSDEKRDAEPAPNVAPRASKPERAPKAKPERRDARPSTKNPKAQEQRGQAKRRTEDKSPRHGGRDGRDGRNAKKDWAPATRALPRAPPPKPADSIPEHFHPSYVEKKKRELELKKLMESAKPTKITFGDDSD